MASGVDLTGVVTEAVADEPGTAGLEALGEESASLVALEIGPFQRMQIGRLIPIR